MRNSIVKSLSNISILTSHFDCQHEVVEQKIVIKQHASDAMSEINKFNHVLTAMKSNMNRIELLEAMTEYTDSEVKCTQYVALTEWITELKEQTYQIMIDELLDK